MLTKWISAGLMIFSVTSSFANEGDYDQSADDIEVVAGTYCQLGHLSGSTRYYNCYNGTICGRTGRTVTCSSGSGCIVDPNNRYWYCGTKGTCTPNGKDMACQGSL